MTAPTTYEIVLRGRIGPRLLRPLIDDFRAQPTDEALTRLVGEARDAAHLHGVVAYLTSVNVELVSIGPVTPAHPAEPAPQPTQPEQPNERNPQP